jgi:hypothetical protein
MAWAGAPPFRDHSPQRVRVGSLEASVRSLDPASRALLDLSLRRRMRDDDMAPLLRIDAFNLAWRRARAIERLASGLGLTDPGGLAQVRAALPYLPESAWCVPPALPPGPPSEPDAGVVEGVAETIEFEAIRPDGHDEEASARELEVDWIQRPPVAEPARDSTRADHDASASSARCSKNSATSCAVGGFVRISIFSSGSGYAVARMASAAASTS